MLKYMDVIRDLARNNGDLERLRSKISKNENATETGMGDVSSGNVF